MPKPTDPKVDGLLIVLDILIIAMGFFLLSLAIVIYIMGA